MKEFIYGEREALQILKVVEKRGITLEGSIPKRQLMKAFGACQWWLSR